MAGRCGYHRNHCSQRFSPIIQGCVGTQVFQKRRPVVCERLVLLRIGQVLQCHDFPVNRRGFGFGCPQADRIQAQQATPEPRRRRGKNSDCVGLHADKMPCFNQSVRIAPTTVNSMNVVSADQRQGHARPRSAAAGCSGREGGSPRRPAGARGRAGSRDVGGGHDERDAEHEQADRASRSGRS